MNDVLEDAYDTLVDIFPRLPMEIGDTRPIPVLPLDEDIPPWDEY